MGKIKIEDSQRGYAFEFVQKTIGCNISSVFDKITTRDGVEIAREELNININFNGEVSTEDQIAAVEKQFPGIPIREILSVPMAKMTSTYIFPPDAKASK